MTSSDRTHEPSEQAERSGLQRHAYAGYHLLLLAFLVAGCAQIFLAGLVLPPVWAILLPGIAGFRVRDVRPAASVRPVTAPWAAAGRLTARPRAGGCPVRWVAGVRIGVTL